MGRGAPLVEALGLTRVYRRGPRQVRAVDRVSLALRPGSFG